MQDTVTEPSMLTPPPTPVMDSEPCTATPPLRSSGEATRYIRRVFGEVLATLSPHSIARARELFHPDFKLCADEKVLDRESFLAMMRAQQAALATPPRFRWKNLVATEPQPNGCIHVTSVHSVVATLKSDGSTMHQKVMALIQIDAESGKILKCDEITRMGGGAACGEMPPFETGFIRPAPAIRRPMAERPSAVAPSAKQARLAPCVAAKPSRAEYAQLAVEQLPALSLTRSGVSDLLGDMCRELAAPGDGKPGRAPSEADSTLETEADTDLD